MHEFSFSSLNENQQKLINSAKEALEQSYHPYSGIAVGAALITKEGHIFTGTNFENSSYGATICAERAAILTANNSGFRYITAIAVTGKGKNINNSEILSPCGICRQVISESAALSRTNIEIIMASYDKSKIIISSIKELLPLAFHL